MKFPKALALAAAFLVSPLAGQGSDELLTTVGTTVTAAGVTHAYVLWQPGEAASTLGKRFAIHAKPGTPESPGEFTRLGIQTLQTSPNTIRALLELGAKIDRAAATANTRIDAIHREITLQQGAAPAAPTDPSLDAAGKLSYLIQSAVSDPRLLSRLFFLGRAHPGVMQVLGHGFSIPVPAGVRTFEIREVDLSDRDVRVVGRVTLDPAAPIVLAAPASPFQVFHPVSNQSQYEISAKDHLNARFRWGVGPALRAQMPYSFGFDMLRVKRKTAELLGWDATPPTPAQVIDALNGFDPTDPDPEVAMVNEMPILVGDLLTPDQAANPADRERFDFSDDGVWHIGSDGRSVRRPYSDGEAFYYFIAARDITGAPGTVSPGTLVQMCDRLPPNAPSVFSVVSNFVRPANPADWASQGGTQFLQVKIRQVLTADVTERATGYYVYRWSSSQEYLNNIGNPSINRVSGLIPHDPARTFITFNDNGAGAPTLSTHTDQSVWYTVRAVGASACEGEVISGHSPPVAGVLRDFRAPNGPTGSYLIYNTKPTAAWLDRSEKDPSEYGLADDFVGTRIEVIRQKPQIVAAEIDVAIRQKDQTFLTIYSNRIQYQLGDTVAVDLPFREPVSEAGIMRIRVRAVAFNGRVSPDAVRATQNSKGSSFVVHRFTADAITEISSNTDPGDPVHESSGLDGTVNAISGTIGFPANQGVKEWRVYRRVGPDGELSLIAKGEGETFDNPGPWQDDALPSASGATVCYYGQILDQNANPSPLIPFGCVTLINPQLPTPMLSAPSKMSENAGAVLMTLEWFCDPVGVERFEILAAVEGGGETGLEGLSPVVASPETGVSSDFPDLAFQTYQTSRVGAGIGAGPGFGVEVRVPADKTVYFAVRACGPGTSPRMHGAASNVVSAAWQPEFPGAQPVIPWPLRPLPGSFEARRSVRSYATGEGPFWPVILPIEFRAPTAILIGLTRYPISTNSIGGNVLLESPVSPEEYLFKVRETVNDATKLTDLMPFMLYRYQLPSSAFPQARPNLVQCTPLIDRISWKNEAIEKGKGFRILDPFLTIIRHNAQPLFELPFEGDWNDNLEPTLGNPADANDRPPYLDESTASILLKDPLPVIQGAKYRHLIVQFDQRGEIKRIIPVQPVQH